MLLEGRVAVITGANRGIGREIARSFAAAGAQLVISARSAGTLAAAAAELRAQGAAVQAVPADVTDPAQVDQLMAAAMAAYGRLDILVNNAGTAGPTAAITDLTPADWAAVIESNLTSAYLCCRAAVPHMLAQQWGRIINLSSMSGKRPLAFRAGYCAAKMGVIGLTRTLAQELGPHNITVNAICPGSVEGERIEQVIANQARVRGLTDAQVEAEFKAVSPLRRFVRPQDIAAMAVLLAGPYGDNITGEDINVTAGVVMY